MKQRFWRPITAVLCLMLALIAGCGQQQQAAAPVTPTTSATQQVTTSPSPAPNATQPAATVPAASPTAAPTLGPNEFRNPVIDRDFPDPDTLKVEDTYYAYATQHGIIDVQMAKSTDLVNWELLDNALLMLPRWAEPGYTWAPEVTSWDDGKTFVMYFTTRDAESDKQCIGVATSDTPEGPFEPDDKPFICQLDQGGSIDAATLEDEDGTQYVLWKNDGNCCGLPVWIYIQKVSEDGLTLEGEPTRLITNDQVWEGTLVEAPTLWEHNDKYYLFYSANSYAGVDYAMGYAVAEEPTGPYTKPEDEPLLATDMRTGAAIGPGGQDIVVDPDGDTWIVYHSWDPTATYRRVMIDELVWEDGRPVVKGPDKGPQPVPTAD